MYPAELEIKYTTESNTSASYLDLLLSIGRNGQLRTSFYDKSESAVNSGRKLNNRRTFEIQSPET